MPPSESSTPSALSHPPRNGVSKLAGAIAPGRYAARRGHGERSRSNKRLLTIIIAVVSVVAVVGLALGLGLYFGLRKNGLRSGPDVDLGYARYRGNYLNNDISEFLGVRYARPPKGDLRWRAPVDPERETDIQDAQEYGPSCLSISDWPSSQEDEDCLLANIWAPTNATAADKLPVMIYIQGGGYTRNANANQNGSALVDASDRNIVFVDFNYRVGLWGFLAGQEVKSDGDLNAGLLDQRFLLQWVQKHIPKFGGDPDRVIIQGSSAGAGSISMHIAAYGGRDDGLFHGAISESDFFPQQPYLSELEYQFERTVNHLECAEADSKMDCLRGKSMNELQKANVPSPFPGRMHNPLFYWTPCVDGDLIQDLPYLLFEQGKVVHVPVLAGTCTNEGSIFAVRDPGSAAGMITFLQDNYPGITPSHVDTILDLYPYEPDLPEHGPWFPSTSRAYGEATFICPTNNVLDELHSVAPNPSALWSYRYNVLEFATVESGIGVRHVAEGTAVFGPDAFPGTTSSYNTYNAEVVPEVQGYWLSFVRALDPNVFKHGPAPVWEPWGTDMSRLVIQRANSMMENVGQDERERCNFWQSIAKDTKQK